MPPPPPPPRPRPLPPTPRTSAFRELTCSPIGWRHEATSASRHDLAQAATHATAEGSSHNVGPPKVVGMGSCGLDYLAAVAAFPKPDEKLRTTALEVPAARRPSLTCAPAVTAVTAAAFALFDMCSCNLALRVPLKW